MERLVAEFWYFVFHRKTFWLLAALVALLVLGALIVVAERTAPAPPMYPSI
jgi:hypothetical protein